MKKIYTVAVLGCGGRGLGYTQRIVKQKDRFTVTALCDTNSEQLEKMHSLLGLEYTSDFTDADAFLAEKRADLIIIATPDRDHVPQAICALRLGYDVLLEKPVSDSKEEIEALLKAQKETGRKVLVCHVLRYGGGYRKCEELLKSGTIGKLYAIDASERVGYWHWAQAYVRGIGASIKLGHPAILAKCCHDLDLIQNYAQSKCRSVSSVGDLSFFTPENAPEGSAERCLDCKYQDECTFSAKKIYIDKWHQAGEPEFIWPFNKVSLKNPLTEEDIRKGLREGEYGRCAFKCPVDKVDHQLVQMDFENGVKASLKMVYAASSGRRITFYGTDGEIIMDERADEISVMPFGKEKQSIKLGTLTEDGHNHGGGDSKIIEMLYDMLTGKTECITSLEESLECHLMGIAAEESRKQGGKLIEL